MEIPEKWAVDFDKHKLESSYPESEFKKSPLHGIWVEAHVRTDTLIFTPYYDGQEPVFHLERGKRKNSNLPEYKSGPYHYRLGESVIKTRWFLSGAVTYNPYYLEISDDSSELKIGNFYDASPQNYDTLLFIRVDK